MPDLNAALLRAHAAGVERLDAQLLLLHAMGIPAGQLHTRRTWLLAHGEQPLSEAAAVQFASLLQRRAGGEPLAYLTGHKEFFGLDLLVDPRVLVPRPDTEVLVEWALDVLRGMQPAPGGAPPPTLSGAPLAALDLGTGSGAIALAIKHSMPVLHMDAVDASADALAVAGANAQRLGLALGLVQGHWLDAVARRYHCIVSNPPYIAAGDAHLPALAHEPLQALVAGADGLDDIRHISARAGSCLHPGGWLLLEHGYDQGPAVRAQLTAQGYMDVATRRDLGGNERCTGGRVGVAHISPGTAGPE